MIIDLTTPLAWARWDEATKTTIPAVPRKEPPVELVVRTSYDKLPPGTRVLVDARELKNPTTMAACALPEDYEREAAVKAAKATPAAPKVGTLKAIVEAGFARIAAAAEAAKK